MLVLASGNGFSDGTSAASAAFGANQPITLDAKRYLDELDRTGKITISD